jgi:hypothetical protein
MQGNSAIGAITPAPSALRSWRNGSKLLVANTGPAYPLREDFKG